MKKLTVAFVCLFCLVASVFAGQNDQAFQQMCKPLPHGARALKFNAINDSGTTVPVSSQGMAVKVWFTDVQGNPYNPTKHRFNPRERFDIWICSNTPVVVSLFQNYPDDRPMSRLVYPIQNAGYTYQPLEPFKPVKIPVSFEMDDDMRTEIMSIVVSKANANGSVTDVVNTGIGNIDSGNSNVVIVEGNNNSVTQVVDSNMTNTMLRFNERMLQSKNTSMRFTPCPGTSLYVNTPTPTGVTCTEKEYGKDVCCILFGHGAIAQYQITLHK